MLGRPTPSRVPCLSRRHCATPGAGPPAGVSLTAKAGCPRPDPRPPKQTGRPAKAAALWRRARLAARLHVPGMSSSPPAGRISAAAPRESAAKSRQRWTWPARPYPRPPPPTPPGSLEDRGFGCSRRCCVAQEHFSYLLQGKVGLVLLELPVSRRMTRLADKLLSLPKAHTPQPP